MPEVSTKQRIIRATLDLVADRGLAGTSVVDIESAAGLAPGRGGFYRHFANKEAALEAAVDQELDRLRERYATPQPSPDLTSEIRQGLRGLEELASVIAIVLRGTDLAPEVLERWREVMVTGSASSGLENVTEAARLNGQDPIAAAVVVTMASVGFHLASQFLQGDVYGISEDAFVQALVAMVGES